MVSFKILIFLLLQSGLLIMMAVVVVNGCRNCQRFSTVRQVADCLENEAQNKMLVLIFFDPSNHDVTVGIDDPKHIAEFAERGIVLAAVNVRRQNELQSIYRIPSEQTPYYVLLKRGGGREKTGRVVKKTRINQETYLIKLILHSLNM